MVAEVMIVCQWVDSEGRLPDSNNALITSSQPTPHLYSTPHCSVRPAVSSASCLDAHAIPPPIQPTYSSSLLMFQVFNCILMDALSFPILTIGDSSSPLVASCIDDRVFAA